MRGSVGVVLLGGVCEGAGGADGEVDSYGGGGGWSVINSTNQHTSHSNRQTHNRQHTTGGRNWNGGKSRRSAAAPAPGDLGGRAHNG